MIKPVPRPARKRRAHLTTLAATAVPGLALAPVAGATFPGRNGSIAYPASFHNGSVETESVISSIPNASAVNCQGTHSDGVKVRLLNALTSVENLPDVESGGSSVQTIVVVKRKNGHRIRKRAIGDAAGAESIGALTWPSR